MVASTNYIFEVLSAHPNTPRMAQMTTVIMSTGMSSARNRFVKKRRISPTIVLPISVRMCSPFCCFLDRVPSNAAYHLHRTRKRGPVLGTLGTGLALGLMWFPPHLRRATYQALGLRAAVHPGGPLRPGFGPNIPVEREVDAGVVRYTEEVAEFARRLADAEERLRLRAEEDP